MRKENKENERVRSLKVVILVFLPSWTIVRVWTFDLELELIVCLSNISQFPRFIRVMETQEVGPNKHKFTNEMSSIEKL